MRFELTEGETYYYGMWAMLVACAVFVAAKLYGWWDTRRRRKSGSDE